MKFEEYAAKIPSILKKWGKENKCSQADIERRIPVETNTYSKWEQGKNIPPFAQLLAFCEIYNVSPTVLLGYEDTAILNFVCKQYDIGYKTIDIDTVEITFPHRPNDKYHNMEVSKNMFFKVLNDLFDDFGGMVDDDPYFKPYKEAEINAFQMLLQTRIGVEQMGGIDYLMKSPLFKLALKNVKKEE